MFIGVCNSRHEQVLVSDRSKGEHVETAKTAFEKSVGKDPTRIMEALKFAEISIAFQNKF